MLQAYEAGGAGGGNRLNMGGGDYMDDGDPAGFLGRHGAGQGGIGGALEDFQEE